VNPYVICRKNKKIKAQDVHHKRTLTELNVNDSNVSLDLDNLECLCRKCHNKETHGKKDEYMFDEKGDLIESYENKH